MANPSHPSVVNSTAIFTIRDESGRAIEDCVIAILNQAAPGGPLNAVDPGAVDRVVAAANAVSGSIMPHSPIHNNVQRGAYSFYIDYEAYRVSSPHWFHIEAAVPGQLVRFMPLTFTQPATLLHTIAANECTYVSLKMRRDSLQTYAIYDFGPNLDLGSTSWMPFPSSGRLSP